MYQKGEYVIYGSNGVCVIEDVRPMDFGTANQEYIVLHPLAQPTAAFYLPQRAQGKLRPVLTREKIDAILATVRQEPMPWIEGHKQRLQCFQQILSGRDTAQLLSLAGCLRQRQRCKGLSSTDRDILHRAEGAIRQEFAFALNLQPEEIGSYIQERLSK